jgi:RNA polymerase sigma factor (sigma-70 family)
MVKNAQLANDLVQDIFMNVYKNLERFQGNAKLSTWIYKIATNAYLDYFRTADHKKSIGMMRNIFSDKKPPSEIKKMVFEKAGCPPEEES